MRVAIHADAVGDRNLPGDRRTNHSAVAGDLVRAYPLGFGGIAGFAVEIAKIIFLVAIILFLISAVVGLVRGRAPTVP